MPQDVREVRVFVASPGDVAREREVVGESIEEINESLAPDAGYRLRLVRWESDAAPSAGRPQGVINEQLVDYDVFVGILWRRIGTPTGEAVSGTVEEFSIARRRWEEDPRRPVMVYFSQQPFMPRSIADLDQMRRVLEFRTSIQTDNLFWEYDGPSTFGRKLRTHLRKRVEAFLSAKHRPGQRSAEDALAGERLKSAWSRFGDPLKRALRVAYNENRMRGDGGIKTEDLFAAFAAVNPPELTSVLSGLPDGSMPAPLEDDLPDETYLLDEKPWFSPCVADTITSLTALESDRISAADVFIDLAKHGRGGSVARLRDHGVVPDRIDALVRDNNLTVLERAF